ncbi:hypothetical protein AK812_SmicGene40067 [Symbiodinium microadriaticum]|uniref:Uncharacterized protein n=1 Tax=Symbiodinium microadriaticum TaxID=2951 RepID=A0A1Q9C9L3_SYMMI|nr:hypothetical protein AK812_SmicGene40067 [Symbiodinium microadriaticum]
MAVHPRPLRAARFGVALAALAVLKLSFVGVVSPRRSVKPVVRRGEGFDAATATPKVKSTISREQLERDCKIKMREGAQQWGHSAPAETKSGAAESPVGRPTEDESSGIPASPSSARRRRTMPDVAAAEEDDGDAGSIPSHPSQVEDDDGSIGDRAFTEPVMPTMADVSDEDIDMSECVSKILGGLRGDAFSI